MKRRILVLVAFALLVSPFAAHSMVAAQSYCQYVCVDDSCRLEQSVDVPCGDADPTVLQVSDDPEAAACLAEPVTINMVTNTATASTLAVSTKLVATGDPQPAPAPAPAPKQDVLLTGFCGFPTMPNNPTQRILPALEKAVKDKCGAGINLTSQCLKVNNQAVRNCKVNKRIVISLGVDGGSGGFRLETAAVNCYVDPFGKVKCDPQCVDPAQPINTTIEAPGPWPTVPGTIGTYPIVKGKPGQTGTYVCNATYYWLCTQKECKPYFIHTPDFPKDKDGGVVTDLAKLICDIVAANKPAAKSLRAWAW